MPAPLSAPGRAQIRRNIVPIYGVATTRLGVVASVLAGIVAVLLLELIGVLAGTEGHVVYAIEAPYTDLALAQQIAQGHYGIVPGEPAAPSSSILFPFLLAAFVPLGLGTLSPLIINGVATLAAGVFALLLARECGLPLRRISPRRLFVIAAVVTVALNLAGLALTGLEHSLHVTLTIAYLLGLVRFVRRGRCDWWWFVCILVQPIIRFEAAAMLVADVLIFIGFRRYAYALLTVLIGVALVGGYSLFLTALGLPLLPSSVLARSDWSNAAVVSHSGILTVLSAILHNLHDNLNSFGAAQILGGLAVAWLWLNRLPALWARRRVDRSEQAKLMTIFFMTVVSLAQLTGGKLGWVPPRYEAYVLALNLCGLVIVYREQVVAWCTRASWLRVGLFSAVLMMIFAGYATQTLVAPNLSRKEYLGPFQLHRFVTEFYRGPVAVDQLGYVNYDNPYYVLDLSGLASETARKARAAQAPIEWMDRLLGERGVKLAILNSGEETAVPAEWVALAELRSGNDAANHPVFYARRASDAGEIAPALANFAAALPPEVKLVETPPSDGTAR
jgi:hypothetical protein